MSVYKYMAGIIADTTPGGEDDDNYDPHQHRKIEKPTTYFDTMVHLLKGSIGAGIMAMPSAFFRLGLIGGCVCMLLVGAFATYCIHLLIGTQYELCKKWRRGYIGYPKSMRLAIQDGPKCLRWSAGFMTFCVDYVLLLWQIGICSIYVIFFAENVKQVCDFYNYHHSLRLHICYQIIPLILLNLIKTLKLLTPLSTLSNLLTMMAFVLVFYYLIEDDLVVESDKLQMKEWEGLPIFIGTTLFALEAVGLVLALEYNMQNPKQFIGLFGLFNIGMAFIIAFYAIIGIFGYLKYGDNIKASLTLNIPLEQKKAQVAKVTFAVAIFLSFPLQNFVAYNILWRKVKKKIQPSKYTVVDYSLRVVLVVLPWLLSLLMPFLEPFIVLFGAFCLSLLAIVFPGVMSACHWYPDRYGICRYRLIRDTLIVVIGMLILASGCYTSILEIVESLQ